MSVMNPYSAQLIAEGKDRWSIDSVNMSVTDWACKNTSLNGRPFSVKGYEFQRNILNDMSPELDCIKISQVGLSEIMLRKILAFLKRNRGTSGIFTLADENMAERISVSRLNPILSDDKVFTTKYDIDNKTTRTKEIKQLGRSFLYIAAAIESTATSINADMVLNDEIDASDQSMLALMVSRMQGSKYRIHQRFSTPTFPGFGIDAGFQSSDQMLYLCKCKACNHWNDPQFDLRFVRGIVMPGTLERLTDLSEPVLRDMDLGQAFVACERCESRLDLSDPACREWVPMYPSRKGSRGYRVSVFSTDKLDIPYIYSRLIKFQQKQFMRGFFNTVLGQAYSDESIQLSDEQIKRCFTEIANPPDSIGVGDFWIGIDVGQVCHIVIGCGYDAENIVEILQVGVHELKEKVLELLKKYPIRAGAIDRHPYTPTADEIYHLSGGRILPVEYRGRNEMTLVKNQFEQITHAQVNRTWFIDRFVAKIKTQSMKISGFSYRKEVFVSHLRAMARNEEPEKEAEWVKLSENDHFFHASAFMVLGPYLADLLKLESQADDRTAVVGISVEIKNGGDHLIGSSKKKLATPILGR